ncbi:hypothetical protein [Amycolatopsis sp. H20-H5]|uniref:hypothetical protein n=1 Tax=Amycolatopsis sp. H20-H5 TaxID=3046309 RepID=UPI002DB87657|nr:hypothetical protein [Amycolatopsis sp. H20-H5]MEC3974861.1 hypothetical protein [Amycolatopsis sp. H20-H5]
MTSLSREQVVDTLTDTRKSLLHLEEIVHHLLPTVEHMRIGLSAYLSAICTHMLLAGRDMASLTELVAALPAEDDSERRGGAW